MFSQIFDAIEEWMRELLKMCIRDRTCTLDLPFGEYYVKELKAPEGFVSSDEVLEFVAEYQGPVSYTHLDVYKRQSYGCAAQSEAICPFCSTSRI